MTNFVEKERKQYVKILTTIEQFDIMTILPCSKIRGKSSEEKKMKQFIELTTESIKGRAVDVGFRVLLPVVVIDSFALTILVADSNEAVCLFEFECLNTVFFNVGDESFSTFCNRSGMSIIFDLFVVL